METIQEERQAWVGKKMTFRSPTRWSNQKATRVIRRIDWLGRPCVKFGGWDDFIVHEHEIIDIEEV